MLQTVSRLLIAEARVPSQAGSRQIFSGQNGTGTGFFLTFCTVFRASTIRPVFHTTVFINTSLLRA